MSHLSPSDSTQTALICVDGSPRPDVEPSRFDANEEDPHPRTDPSNDDSPLPAPLDGR